MPTPLRKYSQNWLANDELAGALVGDIDPRPGDRFLEIGPGEGRLTRALLNHRVAVVAVELDPRCIEALRELEAGIEAGDRSLRVVESDVRERLRAYKAAGITTFRIDPAGRDWSQRLDTLGRALDLVREVNSE